MRFAIVVGKQDGASWTTAGNTRSLHQGAVFKRSLHHGRKHHWEPGMYWISARLSRMTRVFDQNEISLKWYIVLIHHSGRKPWNFSCSCCLRLCRVCLFVGCLLNVSATCECISGTEPLRQFYVLPHWEVADQTFHLTQSQYTDTGPTSPSTDPLTPGAWQGRHWSANF